MLYCAHAAFVQPDRADAWRSGPSLLIGLNARARGGRQWGFNAGPERQGRIVTSHAGTITIPFAGDVMLGRLVNQAISQKGYDHPWGDMLPVLQEPDLFLINLETTLTSF